MKVLYRQFLFRLVDVELLSSRAAGDSQKLLGQIAALLIFIGIVLSVPAGGAPAHNAHPQLRLGFAWSAEHFLISTTMLVAGLFAVLSWEAVFPDRRDVFVLSPLPITTRAIFLAKAAAVATALVLSVASLHLIAGIFWPIALRAPSAFGPVPTFASAPVSGDWRFDELERHPQAGVTIGLLHKGVRTVRAFGAAKEDSIYEIGSVTKTFTGLLLAEAVLRGEVRLDDPVRTLLPEGIVKRPVGDEITLADLATHHSGLPGMPRGFKPRDNDNPFADFGDAQIHAFLSARGVGKRPDVSFRYSNMGAGLLGNVLARRTRATYPELVRERITGPLGMRDTVISMSPEQQRRFLPGFNWKHEPKPPFDLDGIAGAGALRSTASDILLYLDAQMRGATPAMRLTQIPRRKLGASGRIGLAWMLDNADGAFTHGGATQAHTAMAYVAPREQLALIVLSNIGPSTALSADLIGHHILARLRGEPAVEIRSIEIPSAGPWRMAFAYWVTMLLSAVFAFGCVLCVQGLAAQLLPRATFLRVSALIQLTCFAALAGGFFLQGVGVFGGAALAAQSGGWQQYSPPYWFLGLMQQLQGSPAMYALAGKAWLALGAVFTISAAVWAAAYFRSMRSIVETPDIAGRAGGVRIPGVLVEFSVRSLLRSRRHRMLLSFFLGIAFALLLLLVKSPVAQRDLEPIDVPSAPFLASAYIIVGFWIVGVRVVFSMPLEIGAQWIFRMAPSLDGMTSLRQRRTAMYLLALAPPWLLTVAILTWLWPWQPAAVHAALSLLFGLILVELCLFGPRKIPFACSYLPGKSNLHITFWVCVLLVVNIVHWMAMGELEVIGRPGWLAFTLIALAATWLVLLWRVNGADTPILFDDHEAGAPVELGLGR